MRKNLTLAAVTMAALLTPLTQPTQAGAAPGDGVELLADVSPDGPEAEAYAGRMYFPGDTAQSGNELWVTDGTPGGTKQVVDLAPGPEDSNPQALAVYQGRLYFSARTAGTGQELWSSDGTALGTRLVADIAPGVGGSNPLELVMAGDRLYFAADDGVHGREPWSTDGTSAGTRILIELNPGVAGGNPSNLTVLRDRVVYRGDTLPGVSKPFVSGPGIPGAKQLDPFAFNLNLNVGEFAVAGEQVVFRAGDVGTGAELWVSGGQPGDAHLVKDISPGAGSSFPGELTTLGTRVIFAATTEGDGRELWSTDGSEQGTVLVRDIRAGAGASSTPTSMVALADRVVFYAGEEVHGKELWSTRGTADSTKLVADTYAGPASGAPDNGTKGTVVAGQMLYPGADAAGVEPWVTDGDSTRQVSDLAPGPLSSRPRPVGAVGNVAVFGASDGVSDHLYGWTAIGSTTAVTAKRKYTARQARKKRIVLPVTVRSALGTAPSGGTVTLTRNGTVIGSATLVDGSARVRITVRLRPGRTHRVVASWSGASTLATGSTSSQVKVRVRKPRRTGNSGAA